MFKKFSFSKDRKQEVSGLARGLEMEFMEKDEWGMLELLKDFKLFRKGHSKKICHILKKRDEWHQTDIRIFDYRYVISTGKSHIPYKQTVFFIQSKALGLPHFQMKPENLFHKIGSWLGMQDIDFETHPEFSKQYLLKGEDEDYIRHTMNEEVLQFFTFEKDWCLEGINYYMIFYKNKKILSPLDIISIHIKGMKIFEMLKATSP